MADIQSTAWTRPQDWLSLLAGLYLALSPLWVTIDTTGTWAMSVIGGVIAVLAVIALAMPGAYFDEGVTALGGVALNRPQARRNCRLEPYPTRSATFSMSSRVPVSNCCASASGATI